MTNEEQIECIEDMKSAILDLLDGMANYTDNPAVWKAHAIMAVWEGDVYTLKLCKAWYEAHPEAISPVDFEKWIK